MKTAPETGDLVVWLLQAQEDARAAERRRRGCLADFLTHFGRPLADHGVRDLRWVKWAVDEGRRTLLYREKEVHGDALHLCTLPLLERVTRGGWVLLCTNAPYADHIALASDEVKKEDL